MIKGFKAAKTVFLFLSLLKNYDKKCQINLPDEKISSASKFFGFIQNI